MHAPSSKLTALELKLLNASFQPEHVSRHISSILASSALAACAVVAFAVYGLSAPAFGAVTGAVLAIGTLEKIVSQRKLVHYEALVRKLVNRIEELEGAAITPVHGHPAPQVSNVQDEPRRDVRVG